VKAILLKAPPEGERVCAEVSEVPIPQIGAGDLLIEMKACGLCGTDIEKARGEYTAAMPILGHEAVGYVTSVGEGVRDIVVGDRVFPHHHVPCHECFYCLHGNETACVAYRKSNIFPGGFSEFFRVPAWNVNKGGVIRLPSNLGFEEASLIEPTACCIRALDKCKIAQDDYVMVVGAGPVGMLHSLLLSLRGARVIVSDISEPRLRFAEKTEVECVIDASKRDVEHDVKSLTAGRGADVVIVASGSSKAIIQALRSVRTGGKICLFGVPAKGSVLSYDFSDIYNMEIPLIPSYGTTDSETAVATELIVNYSSRFSRVITNRFHIDAFADAVKAVTSGSEMKVVITP